MAQAKQNGARMNIRFPDTLKRKIERAAIRQGVTASHLVRKTMRENLK